LEGFRPLKLIDIPIKNAFVSYIKRISSFYREEICGLVAGNVLFFVKNISPDPYSTFYVDPVKHLEASRRQNIDFCFHSHPETSCEPSVADIELANNALISFLIFSPLEDRFAVYNPKSEETIYFSI
jgi:proteasome lid subunit RPN8/RPN11